MKLEVDSIQLAFRDRKILSSIYLSIESGECVGLIGRNGCGKSSLMKIMAGAMKAQSSSVRIDGKRVEQNSQQILLATQDPCFPKNISLQKALWFFKVDPERFFHALPTFSERRKAQLGKLSLGERKLIESVVMLLSDAPFVLLDEPFTGVSPLYAEMIIGLIEAQKSKGVLVADHQHDTLKQACSQIAYLTNGNTHGVLV